MTTVDATANLSDEELYDRAKFADEESFPINFSDPHLLAGESAVRVNCDHRGMTQKQLAQNAGINAVYLSQIERARRTGSAKTLTTFAEALNVDVDSLI